MKKILTVGTILLLLLSMAGCRNKSDTVEPGNEEVDNNKNTTVVVESPKLPTEYTNEELTELITVEGKTLEELVEHGVDLYDFTKIEEQEDLIFVYNAEDETQRLHRFIVFGNQKKPMVIEAKETDAAISFFYGWESLYKNKPLSDNQIKSAIHQAALEIFKAKDINNKEFEVLSVDKTNEDYWKFVISCASGYIGYGYYFKIDIYPTVLLGMTKDLSVDNIKLLMSMVDYSFNHQTDELEWSPQD